MKNPNHTYNILTENLRKMPPSLSSPEELTGRIMNRIHQCPRRQKAINRGNRSLKRMLSGFAALIVMGIFVYETARPIRIAVDENALIESCFAPLFSAETATAYSRTDKIKAYVCHKQARQQRKEQKIHSLVSLKSKLK